MIDNIEFSGDIEQPALVDASAPLSGRRYRTNFQLALDRFRRQKLAMLGLFIVLFLLAVAIFAPWIAPSHYTTANFAAVNIFPNREYPFGTDQIGHNYLSRVIYGIRTSYLVGFLAVIVACLIGIPLGRLLLRSIDAEAFRRLCMAFDAVLISFGLSRLLALKQLLPGLLAYAPMAVVAVLNLIVLYSYFSKRKKLRPSAAAGPPTFPEGARLPR